MKIKIPLGRMKAMPLTAEVGSFQESPMSLSLLSEALKERYKTSTDWLTLLQETSSPTMTVDSSANPTPELDS